MSPLGHIILILVLLVGNGFFALAEIAVVSSRRARLQTMVDDGVRGSRRALALAESPNDFLSTVQVGITLVGILAGAFGGAELSDDFAAWLGKFEFMAQYAEPVSFLLVVGLITGLSLVIGELIPKQIALTNPEKWACLVAPPISVLARAAKPAVLALGFFTNLFFKITGMQPANEAPSTVTQEEVDLLIRQGTEDGVFHESEQQIVSRVLRLGDRPIRELMTPRPEVVRFPANTPIEEVLHTMTTTGFSNYPVHGDHVDQVLGVLTLKKVWQARLAGKKSTDLKITDLLEKPLEVHENRPAVEVLEFFRSQKRHFAIVVDEYGGLAGVVTDHDLLESIVGNLSESGEDDEAGIVKRDDGSLLISGWVDLDDFHREVGARLNSRDEEQQYHTIAGFLLQVMGRIPKVGEKHREGDWIFEIVDMDRRRIDKVLVHRATAPAAEIQETS